MERRLPLEGLFLHLTRDRRMGLTVRDYHDALRALDLGFSRHDRQGLLWLCQTLWARSDEELRALQLLFREFPVPSQEDISALTRDPLKDKGPLGQQQKGMPPTATAGGQNVAAQAVPAIEFASREQSGIGLPRAQVRPRGDEAFILSERPCVSLRALIIAWRRFRVAARAGPRVELDIDATIASQCRSGILAAPVLVPSRRNQARLVVLLDMSPSMLAWWYLQRLLAESLAESRLGHCAMSYFHNIPGENLYRRPGLTQPVALDAAAIEHPGCALLIVSDAGAARGGRNRERIERTASFLARTADAWHPVAWLNPLPRARWKGSSAASISRNARVTMHEFTDQGLIQAVDTLRGRK